MAAKRLPQIVLDDPTPKNINQIRRINSVCLPVAYQDSFYDNLLKNPVPGMSKVGMKTTAVLFCDSFACAVYYNDVIVGAVCTRFDETGKKIYIMSIGVLAPYRRLGIGTRCDYSIPS